MPTAFALPARILRNGASLGCEILLGALPHGGQQGARRNAWAAMVDDHARSKMRREAERVTAEAQARAATVAAAQ
ncbi:MAG TPA: hypothetical protein VHE83_19470 [Mycobacteriales bacterium]|nr:hypothetical protein [Mycobacteriales bacterium]